VFRLWIVRLEIDWGPRCIVAGDGGMALDD
jgi:hypothetical protein